MSDTLPETNTPNDNNDRPWWGLPCTVTPCFGTRLVQEGNQLHYLADRADIRGQFSDADTLGSCGYVYMAVYPIPATPRFSNQ